MVKVLIGFQSSSVLEKLKRTHNVITRINIENAHSGLLFDYI